MARVAMAQDDRAVGEKISASFSSLDRNGDGVIDREELGQVLQELDPESWTAERLDRLLKLVDLNGDGRIDYDELTQWAFGTGELVQRINSSASGPALKRTDSCAQHFRLTLERLQDSKSLMTVTFMNGESMDVSVEPGETLQTVIDHVAKALELSRGRVVQLMDSSASPLLGSAPLSTLEGSTLTAIIVNQELSESALQTLQKVKGSVYPASHWDLLESSHRLESSSEARDIAEIIAKAQPHRVILRGSVNVEVLAEELESYGLLSSLGSIRLDGRGNANAVARILRRCPNLHHCYLAGISRDDVNGLRSEFSFSIVI